MMRSSNYKILRYFYVLRCMKCGVEDVYKIGALNSGEQMQRMPLNYGWKEVDGEPICPKHDVILVEHSNTISVKNYGDVTGRR